MKFGKRVTVVSAVALSAVAGVSLSACGSSAPHPAASHSATLQRPSESLIQRQQAASGAAAKAMATDNAARSAFEARWKAINWDDRNTIGAQLTSLARFVGTLKASPALRSAMNKLVGDTIATYFATRHVPTLGQLKADASAVQNGS